GRKAVGIGGDLNLVPGAKDTDVALNTKDGNLLFSPRFIAMGHELVHALHGSKGKQRNKIGFGDLNLTATEQNVWSNREEYRTIKEGSLSEQTLRNQYGLSAERFGHASTAPTDKVRNAYANSVNDLDEIATITKDKPDAINQALVNRNFEPKVMTNKTRLALYKASLTDRDLHGALPAGWDINELTVVQIKGIVSQDIPFKLQELGWAPYGLPVSGAGDSIATITKISKYHERSGKGRRYKSLGGDKAVTAIDDFN